MSDDPYQQKPPISTVHMDHKRDASRSSENYKKAFRNDMEAYQQSISDVST